MWPIFYIRNQVYERFWKPFPTSIRSAIATLFVTFCQDPAELTLGLQLVGVHMNVYLFCIWNFLWLLYTVFPSAHKITISNKLSIYLTTIELKIKIWNNEGSFFGPGGCV